MPNLQQRQTDIVYAQPITNSVGGNLGVMSKYCKETLGNNTIKYSNENNECVCQYFEFG